MKKREFFSQRFVYLLVLYVLGYLTMVWGKNFSITGFCHRLIGLSMFVALIWFFSSLPLKVGKVLFRLLIGISIVCFAVDLFCFYTFRTPLSASMIATILETNFNESKSFIGLYFNVAILCIVCGFLGLSLFYLFFIRFSLVRYQKIIGVLALIGGVFWVKEIYLFFKDPSSCRYGTTWVFITPLRFGCQFYLGGLEVKNASEAFTKYRNEILSGKLSRVELTPPPIKNIVLVIGESTQRNRMQLYGYKKPTSPILAMMRDRGELLIFSDVISSHAQTTLSLQKVLTFSDYENIAEPWYQQKNIISIFKAAGYKTFWISNQLNALHGGAQGIVASLTDYQEFISAYKPFYDDVFYDEELLPKIQDGLSSKDVGQNKLFVVHLIGTHSSYSNRYPKEYSFFDDSASLGIAKRTIARYENALRYNDFVVSEIFKQFKDSDSLVIYLPDHGEEVYDFRDFAGHSDDNVSRFMVEIPMIVYASELFKQKHQETYQALQKAINRPYMSDDLIHTILEIAGIKVEGFDPKRSIINPEFDASRKRIVGGKDYDLDLKGQASNY